ncbi:MAG: acetate--CoA ligase family protein [Actinobacteria bacterium]|nr:acetate--CoA ligase family protein [Actinomycetota bacterium]
MDLSRLISPTSVAVVGATDRPGSYGQAVLANLIASGFTGPVIGVHPTRAEALGFPCVPTLGEIGRSVDVVVIATPASTVSAYISEARRLGCGGAVVFAAGFAEVGDDSLDDELVAAARDFAMLGPNGNGLVNAWTRAALWGDHAALPSDPGHIAVISQSGNVGVGLLAHRRGLGLHSVFSVGNAAAVGATDLIGHLATTDEVKVIAAYLEADGDGVALATALAACAESDVRVVILKAGRSALGAAAGQAHTAALAGDQRVFESFMREAGAVLVRDPAELIETARALMTGRRDPRGAAILTCSGGDATLAADIADDAGAHVANLESATLKTLTSILPSTATPGNPLDHTNLVWADTEAVARITEVIAHDANVGHLVYIQDQPAGLPADAVQEWVATRSGAELGANRAGTTVMLTSTMPGQEPDSAVSGLGAAFAAIAALQGPAPRADRLMEIAVAARHVGAISPDQTQSGSAAISLSEAEAKAMLREAGVRVPVGALATMADDAANVASGIGFPVVVKACAAGLDHKSDLGAVIVGLEDAPAVQAAAARILSIETLPPGTCLLVEQLVSGVEVLVSATRTGVVPALVIGLGGIWAEALGEVLVIPLPADPERVREGLGHLRGSAVLRGDRGQQPYAIDALCHLASNVGRLLIDSGASLIELNPVIVSSDGAVAADAVIVK